MANPIRDLSPSYTTPGTRRAESALVVDENGTVDALDVTTLSLGGTAIVATAAEINRVADASARVVAVTAATEVLTAAEHDGKVVTLNRTGGIDLTLPAATGSGLHFRVVVVGDTTDAYTITVDDVCCETIRGSLLVTQDSGSGVIAVESGTSATVISLNSGTTGGEIGDIIELIDVAAGVWFVRGIVQGTGCETTPFS